MALIVLFPPFGSHGEPVVLSGAFNGTYSLHSGSLPACAEDSGDEADGVTPDHDGLRHFAGCLVDHLVAEHDRATLINRGGRRVGPPRAKGRLPASQRARRRLD